MDSAEIVVMTIGHSTRPLDEFIQLLLDHQVTLLVDVRTVPRSRHNPQFNRDTLPDVLKLSGIGYEHMSGLGGLRHSSLKDSPNGGWRNASFRNFADYMQMQEFAENLHELIEIAKRERIALMCAETLPWRCHRSLIADALLLRAVAVRHIIDARHIQEHSLTPWAHVQGTIITYPPVISS